MRLNTSITIDTEAEQSYFDYFRVTMVDEGLRIQAKSLLFARFMETYASPDQFLTLRTTNPWYDGPKSYKKLSKEFQPLPANGQVGWIWADECSFFSGSRPNLLWLTHKDLGTGLDIVVRLPVSLNNFQDYFQECCESIREIYIGCLRKASAEATFSEIWPKEVKEVERV